MKIEPNIEKFIALLNVESLIFQDYLQNSESSEFEELTINLLYFIKKNNIKTVLDYLFRLYKEGNEKVYENLLHLEPLASPIVVAFMKDNGDRSEELIKQIDKIWKTSSGLYLLLKEKLDFLKRESARLDTNTLEKRLKKLNKLIEEHKRDLALLREEYHKNNQLQQLKDDIAELEKEMEVNNIKELEDKLSTYKQIKNEIDEMINGIKKSKTIFKKLPEDDA